MANKRSGKQTVKLTSPVSIAATASIVGPKEGEGPLKLCFDMIIDDEMWGEKSWEKAESKIIRETFFKLLSKADKTTGDINYVIAGDLLNQCIAANFGMRDSGIPFFGVFGACSTMAESMHLGAMLIDGGFADNIVALTSSHFCSAEKQFRFPLELGTQRPPTAQWTVTGAGFGLVSQTGTGPVVTRATIGRVIDLNQSDPFNMGVAMAPAAADTLKNHLKDHQLTLDHYDLIVTGDLGEIGRNLLIDILRKEQIYLKEEQLIDAGLSIYSQDQNVFSGGSGTGCSALYLYSQLYRKLSNKELNRILYIATGALLSPLSTLQKQSIPVIAHAVTIESEGV